MLKFEKLIAKTLGLRFRDDDPVWCKSRQLLVTGGYRAGKTTRAAFRAMIEALNPNASLIWIIGPEYALAQEEFRMIVEWATSLNLIDNNFRIRMPQSGQRALKLRSGCVIQTKSSKHPETLAAVACDGIVMTEPGQMSEEVYQTVLGRLTEKNGWLFMCGTLEDDTNKQRWAWYEDLAVQWMRQGETKEHAAFSLPTWYNLTIYPKGYNDPKLVAVRESGISMYRWQRMYGGIPEGKENPVFPLLYEPGIQEELFWEMNDGAEYTNVGAIGLDFGRTFEHPSAIAVVQQDSYGRYWVRDGWTGYKATPEEIVSIVKAKQDQYGIYQGCVDPQQGFIGDMLGFQVAIGGSGGGGQPTEMRFTLANSLLEQRALYFEPGNENVQRIWDSMKLCYKKRNSSGKKVYDRPEGDDQAQALMYAIELLRGDSIHPLPDFDTGGVKFYYEPSPTYMEGRI